MHKLVIFGSARVDAFLELSERQAREVCDVDTKNCFIQLSFASKIPLKAATYLVGGNGANVAVGTKRLGVSSLLVAELGQGIMADFAKKELAKEINVSFLTQTPGISEGFGGVIVYQGERTILSYYSPERPPFPKELEPSEWAYLTSVGENFEEFFDDVYTWLSKNDTKLVFNPGGRQIGKGKSWLSKYLHKTEVIFVNRQEAEEITGFRGSHGKEKDLLDSLSSLGPKYTVITDGTNGSFAKDGKKYYRLGIMPLDSIERTGAGDAYSSGCLSALIKGKSLQEGMIWGTINSASKIGYTGPQRGLLKENEIGEWLERAESSGLIVSEF